MKLQRYIDFLDRNKYRVIVLITLAVAFLSLSLKNLAYEGNYRIWFDKNASVIQNYDRFRNTFGGDDSFVVAFSDPSGIFTPGAVETILRLTDAFGRIEGVQKVDSLTNYLQVTSEEDDLMVEPFISGREGLAQKRRQALADDLVRGLLIDDSATTTMLAVRLATRVGADEEVNIRVFKRLQEILSREERATGYSFYISGAPAITASLVTVSQHDAMILMPAAVVAVVALLFLLFRSFIGVLVPSVVIVLTFLSVLSFQFILGYRLNNFTVNIPAFVTAVAIADAMHLYLGWVYYRIRGMANRAAVTATMKSNMLPVFLTSMTTATGFASLGLSHIEPISTLGIAITSAALLALVLSVTIVPAILLTLSETGEVRPVSFLNLLRIRGYGAFIARNDKKIVLGMTLLFIVIGYGLRDLRVDSNSIRYFAPETLVRSGSDFIQEKLTGPMIYEVVIDSSRSEGVKDPRFLNRVAEFESALKERFPVVRFTTSLKDIIMRMQEKLNPGAKDPLPKSPELSAQYLLLYSMSLPQGSEISDRIDTDERLLRLSLYCDLQDTSKDLAMIRWIKAWWRSYDPYAADVQGQAAIFAYMQSSVTDTLVVSITATLGIVVLGMFLIFRNLGMLWLFIIPNIAPLLLIGGIMGYLDIPVDIGVAISAAVILGIAVDDTIHFFSKYFEAGTRMGFEENIDYIISHSGNAMILTTLILSVTFALFGLSSFIPNVNFAIVTVCALNLALLFDLLLLPALLSLIRRRG